MYARHDQPATPTARARAVPEPTDAPWTLDVLGDPALAFTVHGDPAPQGSKAYRGHVTTTTKTGHRVSIPVLTEQRPARHKAWRDAVAAAAKRAFPPGWAPLDPRGGVVADLVFTVDRPASKAKTLRERPATSKGGDLDKLVRATADALTTAKAWRDDGRLVACRRLEVMYCGDPDPDAFPAGSTGAVIRLWPVEVTPL